MVRSFLLILSLLVSVGAAFGQTGTFDLVSNGKSIGKCTYKLDKAKDGFHLTERYTYKLGGFDTQIAADERLDGNYAYVSGSLSNLSTQLHLSITPNKMRNDLALGAMQGGGQDVKHMPIRPNFVLLPGYDPGAVQVILLAAITHPTPDNTYDAVIPSNGGGGAATASQANDPGGKPSQTNNAYDATWSKLGEATGTIDGRAIQVRVYALQGGKATTTIYADDGNVLMQADAAALHASYVRSGFKLDAASSVETK